MTIHFGRVPAGSVLPIIFGTYNGSGASVAATGLAVTDIEIYKGASVTQRASDAGYSLIDTDGLDIDGITGINGFSVDTGDNTDSGFYAVGSFFTVVVSAITVDSQTVSFVAATFSLGPAENIAGYPVVDMGAISGDPTAADNLESQYDETGLTGSTFPATQAQVSAIGASSGGALNFAAAEDNNGGAIIDSVTAVGTETGTFANTEAEDGTYHVITHATNAIDRVYGFVIGGARTAVEVTFKGYLTGANDVINMQVYDHVGADWETLRVISGQAGTDNITVSASLLAKHTGTGSELGNVYIRFVTSAQTAPVLNVDQLLIAAVNIGQSAGYSGGFIYFDSNASNTGTEAFVDGTADNPVSSWTAVKSLIASTGLSRVDVVGTLTLDATAEGIALIMGHRSSLALGSQNIGDVEFVNFKAVSGTGTSTGARPVFTNCFIDTVTLPPTLFRWCGFTATMTAGSSGHWSFENCRSAVDGPGSPTYAFASTDNNNIGFTRYARGITISGLAASDSMTINGVMNVITLGGADATVNISGQYGTLTNNLTGSPSVTVSNAFDSGDIADTLADTNELQSDDYPTALAAILTAIGNLNDITAAEVWAEICESGLSYEAVMRLQNSALFGKASGLNTTSVAYRDLADAKDRIAATVDQYGNRSAVTLDAA